GIHGLIVIALFGRDLLDPQTILVGAAGSRLLAGLVAYFSVGFVTGCGLVSFVAIAVFFAGVIVVGAFAIGLTVDGLHGESRRGTELLDEGHQAVAGLGQRVPNGGAQTIVALVLGHGLFISRLAGGARLAGLFVVVVSVVVAVVAVALAVVFLVVSGLIAVVAVVSVALIAGGGIIVFVTAGGIARLFVTAGAVIISIVGRFVGVRIIVAAAITFVVAIDGFFGVVVSVVVHVAGVVTGLFGVVFIGFLTVGNVGITGACFVGVRVIDQEPRGVSRLDRSEGHGAGQLVAAAAVVQ